MLTLVSVGSKRRRPGNPSSGRPYAGGCAAWITHPNYRQEVAENCSTAYPRLSPTRQKGYVYESQSYVPTGATKSTTGVNDVRPQAGECAVRRRPGERGRFADPAQCSRCPGCGRRASARRPSIVENYPQSVTDSHRRTGVFYSLTQTIVRSQGRWPPGAGKNSSLSVLHIAQPVNMGPPPDILFWSSSNCSPQTARVPLWPNKFGHTGSRKNLAGRTVAG